MIPRASELGAVVASLAVGTVLVWVTAELAFVDFARSQTGSPLAPLCLFGAAVAYLAGPVIVARRRQRWRYLALVALAVAPVALVALLVVVGRRGTA